MKCLTYFVVALIGFFHMSNGVEYIIGGNMAPQGIAPYLVSLRKTNMDHVCGGAIINSRWILTAAHCINHGIVYAIAGTNKINSGGDVYEISETIKHPYFLSDEGKLSNDIGLIKTQKSIRYYNLVQSLNLPWTDIDVGEFAILAGWGVTNVSDIKVSNDLQLTTVEIISNEECQKLKKNGGKISDSFMCTFTGRGLCYGDSGSPLVSGGRIYGISSFGTPKCDKNYPEGYARVNYYKFWIVYARIKNWWSTLIN